MGGASRLSPSAVACPARYKPRGSTGARPRTVLTSRRPRGMCAYVLGPCEAHRKSLVAPAQSARPKAHLRAPSSLSLGRPGPLGCTLRFIACERVGVGCVRYMDEFLHIVK